MIFTRTVRIILGQPPREEVVEAEVDIIVDEHALGELVGRQAMRNGGGRSRALGGAILAEVRKSSRRTIAKSS